MVRRPDALIYAVGETPPLATTLFLGLQQVALMAIYLVMVVIVVRQAGASAEVAQSAVSMGLIAMGISAGLQAIPKGPIGSGYLAPPGISAIYLAPPVLAGQARGLPLVVGMTMVAGVVEAAAPRLLPRLRLVFPPLICGFIVAAVGLELGLIGISHLLDVSSGSEAAANFDLHVSVAALTLATMVGLAIWGRGTLRLLCSLAGVVLGLVVAALTGLMSADAIRDIQNAPYVTLPRLTHIGYAFDLTVIVPFVLAGLAAGLRTVGVVTTCQRINDADWKRPDLKTIQGGGLADGIGCFIGGRPRGGGLGSAPSPVRL